MQPSNTPINQNTRVFLMTEEELDSKISGAVERALLCFTQQKKSNENSGPMSVDEAAEYIGCKKQTLYIYNSKGLISAYKPFGKRIFFYKEDLDQFLKSKKKKSNTELGDEADTIMFDCNRRKES